jgi:CheY-like chemotaxis protein
MRSGPPILLVEDDDIDTEIVLDLIADAGIRNTVLTARDGEEALRILQDGRVQEPCIMLLDLNMPRMNGFEFLERVRSERGNGHSVIFVLTTSDRPEDIATAYRYDIAGYIVKDDTSSLIRMLGEYCDINRFPPPDAMDAPAAESA